MNDLPDAVTSLLKALSSLSDGDVGSGFLALAAAGTIAMAALQVIKEVTPYRKKFQLKWFNNGKTAAPKMSRCWPQTPP